MRARSACALHYTAPKWEGFSGRHTDSCMRNTWSVYLGRHLLSILLMVKYASARPAAPLQYFWINDNKGAQAWAEKHRCTSLASQYACMAVSQLHIQNDIYIGPPTIYRPGIDMGKIDAKGRMRDDETEDSARIKALYPGLVSQNQILVSPTIDELFRLTILQKRSHMNATTILHICNCTHYSCVCDNNCIYYKQTTEHCRTEPARSERTPRPHGALAECIHHGVGRKRSHAHTTKL